MLTSPIVIEGADMLGKTTLISGLYDAYKDGGTVLEVQKMGLEHAEWTVPAWLDWAITTSADLIDRSHISEVIYGLICRSGPRIGPGDFKVISKLLEMRGFRIYIAYAEDDVYEEILERRYDPKREAFPKNLLKQVNSVYRRLAENEIFAEYWLSPRNVATYKITSPDEYLPDVTTWRKGWDLTLRPPTVRGSGDYYATFGHFLRDVEMLARRVNVIHDTRNGNLPELCDLREFRYKLDECHRVLTALERYK